MIPLKKYKNRFVKLKNDQHFGEILTGSFLVFGAKIIATIISLLVSVVVARYYGAEVVGVLAIVNSFLTVVIVFTLFGTTTSVLRLIPEFSVKYSKYAAYNVYKKTLLLVLGFSVIAAIINFFLSNEIADNIFKQPDLSYLFMLTSGVILFRSLQRFNTQTLRALKNIQLFAVLQFARPLLYLTVLLIVTQFYYNKYAPVYLQLLAITVIAIITQILVKVQFHRQLKKTEPDNQSISFKRILKISTPMFLTASVLIIMGELATLMTGMFRSEQEVGYYAIAFRIASLTTFILLAVNAVIAPKFSELYHKDEIKELFIVARRSTKLIFWLNIPLILVFVFFGKYLIQILFGAEFEASYNLLLVLSLGLFINAISGSVINFMNMCGHEILLRNIFIISLLISFIMNLILIPWIGVMGAAISTTITQIFWNITLTYFIYSKYSMSFLYLPYLHNRR